MSTSHFDPNRISFDEGLQRISKAVERAGLSTREIITSRHPAAARAQRLLETTNVPGSGFRKWQLPVYLDRPSQLFITMAAPDLEVPEHSHDDGDGIRFIAGGSIIYADHELTQGDWMFIPAGATYSFRVGRAGALMCYCYCCSCAGSVRIGEDVVNPPDPVIGP
ncbi:cupin domain-containing protein [Mycolicibacterium sp.]|uniref:cupin domain-containing protein n=1 Tax=Mycolicibacterium sp. TaxID=2320850 RepID=UPI003D141C81